MSERVVAVKVVDFLWSMTESLGFVREALAPSFPPTCWICRCCKAVVPNPDKHNVTHDGSCTLWLDSSVIMVENPDLRLVWFDFERF